MGKLVKVKQAIDKALDMRHTARMERARGLGFDTDTVYYHGTEDQFDAFDLSKSGTNYGTQGHPSIYLTTSKDDAGLFTGGEGHVVKTHLNTNKFENIDGEGLLRKTYDEFDSYQSVPFIEWRESLSMPDIYQILDLDAFLGHEAGIAFRKGKRGLNVKFTDDGIALVFDPSNIRSVNAAFDPALKESANLLAGAGGAAVGAASLVTALTPEQAQAAEILRQQDNDGIVADEWPLLDRIGTELKKFEFPVLGAPLEGVGNYLQRFGEPKTKTQQAKDAGMAALDLL